MKEFLAGRHKNLDHCQTSSISLYSLMGIDISPNGMFNFHNFNTPYVVVFGVAGVLLISTLIEHFFVVHGNPRMAESVEGLTKLMMPIAFYIFLLIGIFKVL